MSNPSKVPRSFDGSRSSNRPHRERRPRDRPHTESNHSGRRSREDPRDNRQSKPSREPYPSSERHSRDPAEDSYSRPPTARGTPSQPNSRPSSSAPPFYSSVSQANTPPKESFGTKCSYLCSRRGLLQMLEIILNLVVLICAAATQSASAGFASIGGFGSAYYYNMGYANSGFLNHEVQQIGQLDVEYNVMKSATVYCAVGLSVLLLAFSMAFLIVGCVLQYNRSSVLHSKYLPFLIMECVVKALAAVAYLVGVALYLHFIFKINATDVCKQRESLYNRHGYSSVKCAILGTEVAVSIFAVMLVIVYIASLVFGVLAYREIQAAQSEHTKSLATSAIWRHATPSEIQPMKS
ncbi:MARVEL domain-containing protein 3-like isoform X2 [Pristis pectinata]|uniref:MARVEL domain-containing protein 3-like isoform X2 n=1 Tax=Pristis pectinata TaxID=685728 RepID=UPI00223CB8C7|nr:MARVEL domain-containing protein 3-like isoform X2 [Pristis pectinata]